MSIWRRLRFHRSAEAEMQEELRSLQELAEPRELGNLTYAAEEARAQWRFAWLDNLFRDLRYAVRVLARQPSFTAVAVLSLGLGIGATTAIFSLVDRVLWRQLPVREPERLVNLEYSKSYFAWQQYRAKGGDMFEGVIGTTGSLERSIGAGGEAQPANVELVTGSYFDVLGVAPLIGRTLTLEDDDRGQPQAVAVLSYNYWQRAFGGDAAVLGRKIHVAKVPFTIAGVARPEFFGVAVGVAPDMWLPLSTLPEIFPGRKWLDSRDTNFMMMLARLRPGVTAERAATALTPLSIAIDIERAGAGLPDWIRKKMETEKLKLIPASQGISILRQRFSKPLHVLFALVGIVMLLACVNVMGLQFSRADERRRELAVRLAVGAGRGRVVRQLLTESLVIAAAGGVVGLAICRPAASAVASLVRLAGQPVQLGLQIDKAVLLFVFGIAMFTTMICGLAPALRATGPKAGLQQNARSATAGPRRRVVGRTLASVQMALSVVLIAGAFLFSFSLYRLTRFETGLDRRGLVVADVEMREAGYKPPQMAALNFRIFERLRAMKNVEAVSFTGNGLYSGRNSNTQMGADGFQAERGPNRNAFYDRVGPGYFTTLRTRILAGRDFIDRDMQTGGRVAIVTQEFARHFFPAGNPVGRNIYSGDDEVPIQVVGLVEDIRTNVRQAPRRFFYLPALQVESYMPTTRFVVRTRAGAADLRAAIRAEDSGARVLSIDTADELLNRTLDLDRLIAMLSFAFGILAIILAAVGIYGLLAYDVTRRTGEIGIRMALGATKALVMTLVFREVVIVAAAGLTAGIMAALALQKLVTGLVFEMKPGDPVVLASAAVVLATVAAAAAWLPARRAASLDPMTALRHD